MQEVQFSVTGMSCVHCIKAVEKALDNLIGVEGYDVAIGEAKVRYDGSKVNADEIRRAIDDEGYSVET